MDLVSEYFKFKKSYMREYCTSLMGSCFNDVLRDEYLDCYINTYINSYYFGILDTLDEKKVEKVKYPEICEELKGRCYELQYLLSDDKKINTQEEYANRKNLIMSTYTYALFAVILDLKDYTTCKITVDYEQIVTKVFEKNSKLIKGSEDKLREIIKLVRKNTKVTRDYLDEIEPKTFFLAFDNYRGNSDKYTVKMHYKIKQITNNHKKIVVDKVYNDKDVYAEKLMQKINLVNVMLLNKTLNKEDMDYYFVNLPLEDIDNRSELKEFINMTSNPVSRKHLVFVVNYKDYMRNKSIVKTFTENSFALLVDLSHARDAQAKMEEFETMELFKYIIIDDVRSEDSKLVLNYEIDGKEIFQNKYEFSSKEV